MPLGVDEISHIALGQSLGRRRDDIAGFLIMYVITNRLGQSLLPFKLVYVWPSRGLWNAESAYEGYGLSLLVRGKHLRKSQFKSTSEWRTTHVKLL